VRYEFYSVGCLIISKMNRERGVGLLFLAKQAGSLPIGLG
jgi:hypothetical protein